MCQLLLDTEEVWMWEECCILQGHRHILMFVWQIASISNHMALFKFT